MNESKGRVFVVHQPMIREGETFRPQYNLSPALEYGEIVYLFRPGDGVMYDGSVILTELERRFAKNGLNEDDYLLLIGDPLMIALSAIAAVGVSESVSLLKWDRRSERYFPYKVTVQS